MQFRASSIEEVEDIAVLMQHAFHVSGQHASLDRSFLTWKYYDGGPAWPGPRSYVLEHDGALVAHAAIWPVKLRLRDGVRSGISFGDWVSDEKHRGAGLLLLRHLQALASFVLVTGGAPVTRAILPRVGFEAWGTRERFARVLRPFRQSTMRNPSLGAREPLRLLRNLNWSFRGSAPVGDWVAEAGVPDEGLATINEASTGSSSTSEFLKFLLRCPTTVVHFVWLRQAGEVCGYGVFSVIGGVARLGDLRLCSEDQSDWNTALAALVLFVKTHTLACEITAIGSVPKIDRALVANGFVPRGSTPLVVYDPESAICGQPVVQLGMWEDDALVLPESGFLT